MSSPLHHLDLDDIADVMADVIREAVGSPSTKNDLPETPLEVFASEVGRVTGRTDNRVKILQRELEALKLRLADLEKAAPREFRAKVRPKEVK